MPIIPGEDPGTIATHWRAIQMLVIPGEDPGTSVDRRPLQRVAVRTGSRLKAGMTEKKAGMTEKKAGMTEKKAGMTEKRRG